MVSQHTGARLVKQRRALVETNPPRNSQSETHPDDEWGRRPEGGAPLSEDRFPDAWENSSRKLPRSGILFREDLVGLELGRRQVAERRVEAFLVVDLFEELADRSARLGQVAVFVAQDLLVLERLHERFAGRVIPRIAFARHADGDAVALEQAGVIVAGVLRAAIGVMHQARFDDAA